MIKTRTKKIMCVSSLTEDDHHILIWDFDGIDFQDVLKSLSKTQSVNGLGEIFIFKSKNGHNAICLDKVSDNEAYNIKLYTRFCDYYHTKIGRISGSWCWRVGEDKLFERRLLPTKSYRNREQSNAHRLYLHKNFNIDDFQGNFDESKNVFFESYLQDVI